MAEGITWTQWITIVEIPLLLGLVSIIVKNRRDLQAADTEHSRQLLLMQNNLADYKLAVAEKYASIAHLQEVEGRMIRWLERVEKKLDLVLEGKGHGHD